MKKRIMSLCAIAIMSSMALTLTACGSDGESENNETSIESNANANSTNTNQKSGDNTDNKGDIKTIAKITSIDGNNITFVTADRGQKPDGKPDGQHNVEEPLEPPTGDNKEKPLEPPTGDNNGERPNNELPAGDKPDGQMPEMNFGTEESTITVDSSILFFDNMGEDKTAATISDLNVDSIIDITFDEDGVTPKEITIKSNPNNK